MFDDLDLTEIQDENARQLIHRLLNLIEQLTSDLWDSQAENQQLRDEFGRFGSQRTQFGRFLESCLFYPELLR